MRRYTDRLHLVAGRVTVPCPVTAGRRERRRPAEALPLGQLRVCTTLFGPFTPLRCPGFGEGSPAVTNLKGTLIFTRFHAAARGSLLGLVTAHARAPRQRSSPTREASLGLGLPSALPGGRSVGLSVARHIVWGRWCRARSRRLKGAT